MNDESNSPPQAASSLSAKGSTAGRRSVTAPGLLPPKHPVPPSPHQQDPPGELPRALPVPAVDALAVAEHALPAAIARAVPAVPGPPDLGHAPLHGDLIAPPRAHARTAAPHHRHRPLAANRAPPTERRQPSAPAG